MRVRPSSLTYQELNDMANNKAALDLGFKKAKQLISGHIFDQLVKFCNGLVVDAIFKSSFQSFTGNTITSFACGIYVDGALSYMVASGEGMRAPVHAKIEKGETVFLQNPYEGSPRSATGKVGIVYHFSGMETSFKILQSMKPSVKGFSVIMTTGTEYSTYLENVHHLNVLSETGSERNVMNMLYSSFKPLR